MRVFDVMSKAVETVKPNVAASEADAHAAEENSSSRRDEWIATNGLLSERDLGGTKLQKALGTAGADRARTRASFESRSPPRQG